MDSNEAIEVTEEISNPPTYNCNACGEIISSNTNIQKLNCGHTFHSACLSKCVKTRLFCPICNARISNEPPTPSTSQRTTRSQSKLVHVNTSNADWNTVPSNNSLSGTEPGADLNQGRLQALLTNIVSAQQEQFYSSLSTQLSQIIEKSIEFKTLQYRKFNHLIPPPIIYKPFLMWRIIPSGNCLVQLQTLNLLITHNLGPILSTVIQPWICQV